MARPSFSLAWAPAHLHPRQFGSLGRRRPAHGAHDLPGQTFWPKTLGFHWGFHGKNMGFIGISLGILPSGNLT